MYDQSSHGEYSGSVMRLCGSWGRRWGVLVASLGITLVALQLLHIALLHRLDEKLSAQIKEVPSQVSESENLFGLMSSALNNSNVMDSSGEYYIVHDLYPGSLTDTNERSLDVTLITQCSLHLLHHIVDLTSHWQAPISIAVFAPGNNLQIAMHVLVKLHFCMPSFRKYVSVHVAFPLTAHKLTVGHFNSEVLGTEMSCQNVVEVIQGFVSSHTNVVQSYNHGHLKYPNNLLRNIAATAAKTHFILVIDVDMLPSPGLREGFIELAKKELRLANSMKDEGVYNTAYVIPSFEIREDTTLPFDKANLLQLWKKSLLRPFYHEMCWKCQKPTNYEKWRQLTVVDENLMNVAYTVEWRDPWEPFFIAPHNMPKYDERFKQYGFNRISQVCELHVVGFRFAVLDTPFLLHMGYKEEDSFHGSKETDADRNRFLFRRFKEGLKVRYPNSTRRCY